MKKLLMVLSVLFLMSGCDNANETLSCSSTNTTNGVTTKTTYDISYQDDDVKYVTITYDYSQAQNNNNGTNTDNNGTNTNDNNNMGTDTENNARTGTANNNNNNEVDGVNADTDGISENNETDNNNAMNSDDVVDGVVGDTIDGTVDGIKDTILDLAGIKTTYENQFSAYDNIEGFSYDVDVDNSNEYRVIYKIDMDKISDSDLTRFNVGRDFTNMRSTYEGSGYTCK